jgi:polyisoprenoid-binding protein YceI
LHGCPCGFYGDSTRACCCTAGIIQPHLAKVSGTLPDRIGLHGLMARRKHTFFVEQYSGLVEYDSEHPEKSRVEIFFDANSVVSRDEWINSEKRRELVAFVQNEILTIDRHAQIAFSSGRVERKSSTRFELEGTLTIRDNSRQVACEVVIVPHGKGRLEVDGTARITLSDFHIERPSALFGLIGTKDEINLRFLLWPERVASAEKKFKAVSG